MDIFQLMVQAQIVWILIGLIPTILVFLILLPPRWLLTIISILFPGVIYFAATERPEIALTIDDGPDSATTNQILDILACHGATATFFIITDRIFGNEQILDRMLTGGHEP
jgi:peptidoglycan-N-acetylglucosamine deacetylase